MAWYLVKYRTQLYVYISMLNTFASVSLET